MSAVLPSLPNRSQEIQGSELLPLEKTDSLVPEPFGAPLTIPVDTEIQDDESSATWTGEREKDWEQGACGGWIDPNVSRAVRSEMSGFDEDDLGDGETPDEGVVADDEDDLDEFDEIDEDDFDDDFDDDFEEELEDEYEIEIEDEISAEFGLGPDKDDIEELDDLDSLADDLDDLDADDLKD